MYAALVALKLVARNGSGFLYVQQGDVRSIHTIDFYCAHGLRGHEGLGCGHPHFMRDLQVFSNQLCHKKVFDSQKASEVIVAAQ